MDGWDCKWGLWDRTKGVFPRSGTPRWMVKIMEIPIKMDDLGVPLFSETPKWPKRGVIYPNYLQVLGLHFPYTIHDIPKTPKFLPNTWWRGLLEHWKKTYLRRCWGVQTPTHKVLGCVGYGIFTYIYHTIQPNVGKHTIHIGCCWVLHPFRNTPCNA